MAKPLDDAWAWLRVQAAGNAPILIVLALVVLIGGAWGRARFAELVDERMEPYVREMQAMRVAQDRYDADVHEFAKDLRELYRVTPYLRRSERLEAPFPVYDGGP